MSDGPFVLATPAVERLARALGGDDVLDANKTSSKALRTRDIVRHRDCLSAGPRGTLPHDAPPVGRLACAPTSVRFRTAPRASARRPCFDQTAFSAARARIHQAMCL